ncbi:MAG TPA: efflux RND transporter periplasmic adaptor subunit [Methylovirgula sp.]|nr:efflux RND transporter periplasmic adaptor subunit [Methylovirgula sp.]
MLEKPTPAMRINAPHEAPEIGTAADTPRKRGGFGWLLGLIVLGLLGGGIYYGIHGRTAAEASLTRDTNEMAVPIVDVVAPQGAAPDQALVLPGQTMAFTDTPIYARTNGYLKKWYFDIGARVKEGDLLAEIETPEIDQQLRQARADLTTAEANAKLADVTAQRAQAMADRQAMSLQQRDNAVSALAADQAIVASNQANVARLEKMVSYEKVYAPFDGVITARNTDIGALINAGAGAPNTELYRLQATHTLRIYVGVPEMYVPSIHVGSKADVTLDEYPGQKFQGTLVRTDNAINSTTRTLRVEVDVDNADGKLLPGAYTFVHFLLPGRGGSVTVPANTLLFRREGLQVGVVRDGKAQLVSVTIGRDYGDKVEVISGLTSTDQVILNPSDSLISGTEVRVNKGKPGAK